MSLTLSKKGIKRPTLNEVILYEVWDSKEAHQKYVNWRVEIGDIPKLVESSTKEPEIIYHEEVY